MVDLTRRDAGPGVLLASGSRYRAELLRRILRDFEQRSPDVDERPRDGEDPRALSERLARAKATAVEFPGIVIGSDQVAGHGARCLGKPGNQRRAKAQLAGVSGDAVTFYTSVCVRHGDSQTVHTDQTTVEFRTLTDATIERYLKHDQPYDCAGSFRIEAAAPLLLRRVVSDDPTALIGLPLIWLAAELERHGLRLPG